VNLVAAGQRGQNYRSDGGSIEGWGSRRVTRRRTGDRRRPISVGADGFAAVQQLLEGRHRVARVYRVWLQGVAGRCRAGQGRSDGCGRCVWWASAQGVCVCVCVGVVVVVTVMAAGGDGGVVRLCVR
jgi:hypothetical protein